MDKTLDFGMNVAREGLVASGIVEIGEHEVLPDKNAELVAKLEELRRLVSHRAADADHVHTGAGGKAQKGLVVRARTRQANDIGRRPDSTAAEDGLAIYAKAEPVAVDATIDFNPAGSRSFRAQYSVPSETSVSS